MTKFLGLNIMTKPGIFMPRPETELLVRTALNYCDSTEKNTQRKGLILDIGTGTGNIAVSLTTMNETCKIVALDISEEALALARENAVRFGVCGRIEFIKSDIYSNLNRRLFDIVVSNPPYIPSWEIYTLAGHVKRDPLNALDGGEDGLSYYKRIINGAPDFLKKGGHLVMEMGYNQSFHIRRLLAKAGNFFDIEVFKDVAGIDRVIGCRFGAYKWTNS